MSRSVITGDQPRASARVRAPWLSTLTTRLCRRSVRWCARPRQTSGRGRARSRPRARRPPATSRTTGRTAAPTSPHARRSGVLEVEDRDAEASQVVPLLDDRRHVVTGDAGLTSREPSGRAFHQSWLRLKLLEALGASGSRGGGSSATLATVGAAMGVDPPGVESVVNSPMSAPPDRLPFSRVERRARRSAGSQRQAVAAVVNSRVLRPSTRCSSTG